MQPAIIVHGGAGRVDQASIPERLAGCRRAAEAGWRILQGGGTALDAVVAATVVLEDDPLFNAGTGSTLNINGVVETDAAVMDGTTRAAGAVAAVSGIRNPVRLARAVLDDGRHVMLAGSGAVEFAREHAIEECDPAELVVATRRAQWERDHGTVGCVACDVEGRLAAATSTGGIYNKLPGRVGDSPLIGCGTYADSIAAVSCTGDGEAIIRLVLAHYAAQLVADGASAAEAARAAVAEFGARMPGEAGLIIVDRSGRPAHAKNSPQMPVCAIDGAGVRTEV